MFVEPRARAEVAATLLRHVREGALTAKQASALRSDFLKDIADGVWTMLPVSDDFMARVARSASIEFPRRLSSAAGDAIHLAAADEAGLREVWTNDRHMLRGGKRVPVSAVEAFEIPDRVAGWHRKQIGTGGTPKHSNVLRATSENC